jgi:hypothetical protein
MAMMVRISKQSSAVALQRAVPNAASSICVRESVAACYSSTDGFVFSAAQRAHHSEAHPCAKLRGGARLL